MRTAKEKLRGSAPRARKGTQVAPRIPVLPRFACAERVIPLAAVAHPLATLGLADGQRFRRALRWWPWGRTTAWKTVKSVMRSADIADNVCKPKALRHAFAVEAGQQTGGHSRVEGQHSVWVLFIQLSGRTSNLRCWSLLSYRPSVVHSICKFQAIE